MTVVLALRGPSGAGGGPLEALPGDRWHSGLGPRLRRGVFARGGAVSAGAADRFASPAARRLAAEHGLSEVGIVGTGRDGLVTVADVRRAAPVVPAGLGDAGLTLWRAVRSEWTLRPDEEALLVAACRTVDELGRLEEALADASPVVAGSRGQTRAHPLVSAVREHRRVLRELLGSLGLAEADALAGEGRPDLARSQAGRQLVRQRWNKHRGRG